MPNDYIIWGSSGHSKVLADVIYHDRRQIIALFDNDSTAQSSLAGVPLFSGEGSFSRWMNNREFQEPLDAAIAIGGDRGKFRRAIGRLLTRSGINLPLIIHQSATISPTAKIGEGTQVLAGVVIAAEVKIGAFCIANNSTNIDHECLLADGVHIAPGATLCGCVSVGENSMIGAGAVILPRITIGKNVVVGAGAVVTKDIPSDVTAVGNPAKIIHKNS